MYYKILIKSINKNISFFFKSLMDLNYYACKFKNTHAVLKIYPLRCQNLRCEFFIFSLKIQHEHEHYFQNIILKSNSPSLRKIKF